jgi:fumarate hydratase subunit alpha
MAKSTSLPICQDTGLAVIFADIGQEVHFTGGNFEDAVNDGVAQGYIDGLLRCSIVADPFERINTENNTPAVIHTRIVTGDKVKLTVAPKGFGSENKSRIKMFTPSASEKDIIDFVLETIEFAGSSACPPMVIGVGIGGNFESCAVMSKRALCRNEDEITNDEKYRRIEEEIRNRANGLNIGPQGFGGSSTVLKVAVESAPTHIAGLPVAVNVGCHVTRHKTVIL